MAETDEESASGRRSMLRAFRHRNFRLYFGGQSISLIGTWIQQIALGWTMYQLTHSSWLLGLVSFAGQVPLFILTPFAGVMVDRWNRHRTLVITQSLSLIQALILPRPNERRVHGNASFLPEYFLRAMQAATLQGEHCATFR